RIWYAWLFWVLSPLRASFLWPVTFISMCTTPASAAPAFVTVDRGATAAKASAATTAPASSSASVRARGNTSWAVMDNTLLSLGAGHRPAAAILRRVSRNRAGLALRRWPGGAGSWRSARAGGGRKRAGGPRGRHVVEAHLRHSP